MITRKYQIFISSTFEDLKSQRQIAINAVLQSGNIPVGMEAFSASGQSQFDYITKIIDESDYFILIIGNEYGSICNQTGLSYTEMEYDYAVKKNLPVLAFVYDSKINNEKLMDFKNKVLNPRLIKFAGDSNLEGLILNTLEKELKNRSSGGWVKLENFSKTGIDNLIPLQYTGVIESIKENRDDPQCLDVTLNFKMHPDLIGNNFATVYLNLPNEEKRGFICEIKRYINEKTILKSFILKEKTRLYHLQENTWKNTIIKIGAEYNHIEKLVKQEHPCLSPIIKNY